MWPPGARGTGMSRGALNQCWKGDRASRLFAGPFPGLWVAPVLQLNPKQLLCYRRGKLGAWHGADSHPRAAGRGAGWYD